MPTHDLNAMSLAETLDALGLTTTNMALDWIISATPPNARLTAEGGWSFSRADVEVVRERLAALRARNACDDLTLANVDDAGPVPLL